MRERDRLRLMGESLKLKEELIEAKRKLGQEVAPSLLSSMGAMAPVKMSDESA